MRVPLLIVGTRTVDSNNNFVSLTRVVGWGVLVDLLLAAKDTLHMETLYGIQFLFMIH